jgi:hypothetical protein
MSTRQEIEIAAAAIANVRAGRRGAPAVGNVLEVLRVFKDGKLLNEVMEDARAAIEAVDELRKKRSATAPRLTDKAQREIEGDFENTREAFILLDLVAAEFASDPMSVQCFDLRIVERVKECVAKRKAFVKAHPVYQE